MTWYMLENNENEHTTCGNWHVIIFIFLKILIPPTLHVCRKFSRHWTVNKRYCIYPKYSDTSTPYHTCSKIWTCTIYYLLLCQKIAGWVANSVDFDEMPHSVASQLGLHYLLSPVCPNTYDKYGIFLSFHIHKKGLLCVSKIITYVVGTH